MEMILSSRNCWISHTLHGNRVYQIFTELLTLHKLSIQITMETGFNRAHIYRSQLAKFHSAHFGCVILNRFVMWQKRCVYYIQSLLGKVNRTFSYHSTLSVSFLKLSDKHFSGILLCSIVVKINRTYKVEIKNKLMEKWCVYQLVVPIRWGMSASLCVLAIIQC